MAARWCSFAERPNKRLKLAAGVHWGMTTLLRSGLRLLFLSLSVACGHESRRAGPDSTSAGTQAVAVGQIVSRFHQTTSVGLSQGIDGPGGMGAWASPGEIVTVMARSTLRYCSARCGAGGKMGELRSPCCNAGTLLWVRESVGTIVPAACDSMLPTKRLKLRRA